MKFSEILESYIKVDTSFVKKELKNIKNKLIGKKLGNLEIEKILNNIFKKYDINFEYGTETSSRNSNILAHIPGGYINMNNGQITIEYNSKFWELFDDDEGWKNFIQLIQRMIGHESIHKQQMIKIRKKYSHSAAKLTNTLHYLTADAESTVKYMSKPIELMAYAYEAAAHLLQIGYKPSQIKKLLRKPFGKGNPNRIESDIFYAYTEWFDEKDKVLDKFLKYMYEYIESI